MTTKTCIKCTVSKPLEDFHLADAKTGRRKGKCKDCQAKYIQEYKAANPEKIKDRWRQASRKYYTYDKRRNKTLRKYGLTEADYNEMYDEQGGLCKICSQDLTLVVDHCHNSEIVRGLLCNGCNVGLGCFEDDIDRLQAAVKYLEACGWEVG